MPISSSGSGQSWAPLLRHHSRGPTSPTSQQLTGQLRSRPRRTAQSPELSQQNKSGTAQRSRACCFSNRLAQKRKEKRRSEGAPQRPGGASRSSAARYVARLLRLRAMARQRREKPAGTRRKCKKTRQKPVPATAAPNNMG